MAAARSTLTLSPLTEKAGKGFLYFRLHNIIIFADDVNGKGQM